jgi:hypothetical protein
LSKIKISKEEFDKAYNFRKKLNEYKLSELDLSEFGIKLTDKQIREFNFSGLDIYTMINLLRNL